MWGRTAMLVLLMSDSFCHHLLRRWRRRIIDCFWEVGAHVRWLSTVPVWSNNHTMRTIRGEDLWLCRIMAFHRVASLSIHRFRDHRFNQANILSGYNRAEVDSGNFKARTLLLKQQKRRSLPRPK